MGVARTIKNSAVSPQSSSSSSSPSFSSPPRQPEDDDDHEDDQEIPASPCKDALPRLSVESPAAATRGMLHRKTKMKKLTAFAIVILVSPAIATLGGQPVTSSTQTVSPPSGFFRPNEFETGAFGTFATGIGSSANSDHAWGGGLDVTHWLPWKYGGIRFQGTGTNVR